MYDPFIGIEDTDPIHGNSIHGRDNTNILEPSNDVGLVVGNVVHFDAHTISLEGARAFNYTDYSHIKYVDNIGIGDIGIFLDDLNTSDTTNNEFLKIVFQYYIQRNLIHAIKKYSDPKIIYICSGNEYEVHKSEFLQTNK